MPTIGENIKRLRIEQNMTQEQLAQALNTTKSTISKYELDKRQPRYETIEQMAKVFRTSTGKILNRGGQIKYKVVQWKSRKDVCIGLNIDSELHNTIRAIATDIGLSTEDLIEKVLLEYSEAYIEDKECQNPHDNG